MAKPRFSVSQITTFHQTYEQDLASYAAAGVEGVGVWQFKLPEGDDGETVAKLKDSGLKATTMIPGTLSIHPVPFPGPTIPKERTEGLCDAVRRFAPFEPEVMLVLHGAPPAGTDPGEARRVTVEGSARPPRSPPSTASRSGWSRSTARSTAPGRRLHDPADDRPDRRDRRAERAAPLRRLSPVGHRKRPRGDRATTEAASCRASTSATGGRRPGTTSTASCPGDGIIDLPGILGALEAGGVVAGSTSRSSRTTARSPRWTSRTRSGSRRGRRARVGKGRLHKAWDARRPPA